MRKARVQNILTEKETQLNSLVQESTDAVSFRAELDRIQGSMDQQIAHNEKIIGKFKSFLED